MNFGIVIGPRVRKSPFFDATVAAGVQSFTIYNHTYLPISYGDPEGEYWRLVKAVSLWDVAAERQVEVAGPDAARLIRYLTPRNLSTLVPGKGRYVPMCDHEGRLINDPVLLMLAEDRFWLSIADSDVVLWARAIASEGGYNVTIRDPDVAPLAVQGPLAVEVMRDLFGGWVEELKAFWFRETDLDGMPVVVARTGWSKQGGYEIFLQDPERGQELWDRISEAGRDYGIGPGGPNYIERVESALLSVGADTDDDTDPFEVRLDRFVDLERDDDFIGKTALIRRRQSPRRLLHGMIVDGGPLPPNQHPWPVYREGRRVGSVRAAAYSPRLQQNIGLAILAIEAAEAGGPMAVETEMGPRDGTVTDLPFIRK